MSNETDQTRLLKRGDDNWLPPGWTTQEKVRTSGTRAGVVDKFYYEPVTGRKFRSRNEVLYYLEHGTKKPIKKPQYSSNTKSQPQPPPNFDFLDVPDKVTWKCINGPGDVWWPYIGDCKVPDFVFQDWKRAFTLLTAQNNGKTHLFKGSKGCD